MYGGESSHLPLKINTAGVIPAIFASALLLLPVTLTNFGFAESDLFINSSFFEGFPNAVVESLKYNVPVICSKSYGGIFDILKNNKYGYLFNLHKIENLSSLILKFLKNSSMFLKKTKDAKNNLKRFTIKKCVFNYEKLLDKL